jgi:hypothetical protein
MWRALEVWRTRNPVESMIEDARTTNQQRLKAAQYKKYIERAFARRAACWPTSTAAQQLSRSSHPVAACRLSIAAFRRT